MTKHQLCHFCFVGYRDLWRTGQTPSCLFLIHPSLLSGIHCCSLGLSPPFFPTWLQQGGCLGENFRIKNTSLSFSLSLLLTGAHLPAVNRSRLLRHGLILTTKCQLGFVVLSPHDINEGDIFISALISSCRACIHGYAHVCICGAVCGTCVLCVYAHESVCNCVCMHMEARSQGWVSSSIMFHLISWDRASV